LAVEEIQIKVAVSAEAAAIMNRIDPEFSDVPWFVIVDTDSG
jgi:hypothetical protein